MTNPLARRSTAARSPFRRTIVPALLLGPLALTLVACGDDDDDDDARTTTTENSSAPVTPDTSAPAPADSSAPSPEGGTGSAGGDDALLAAATTALAEVSGSTIFTIDANNQGWEISLVAADGTESEVDVSADGATVTRGPVPDDDRDETDDVTERQRLLQDAGVDYAAAIEAARTAVPQGTVTSVDLDEDNGTATWDVQLDEDTADEQTVTIDAASGEVLRTERDD